MQCTSNIEGTLLVGDKHFRKLDHRSWDVSKRLEDMDAEGISMQVLSPMPELLSYWLDLEGAQIVCEHVNEQIAEMVALAPTRFRGLGAVPLQSPEQSAKYLSRLKNDYGFDGVEIGSNINGLLLGDPSLDPFWQAAQDLDMAIFVHALHPIAVKSLNASPLFTAFAGFPIDVGMSAASMMIQGTLARFPKLRVAWSHGGGTLGAMLGRLDRGWSATDGYGIDQLPKPSDQARNMFYDSNVYDPNWLQYITREMAPGQVFAGTDYPYLIRQEQIGRFLNSADLTLSEIVSVKNGAAKIFLKSLNI